MHHPRSARIAMPTTFVVLAAVGVLGQPASAGAHDLVPGRPTQHGASTSAASTARNGVGTPSRFGAWWGRQSRVRKTVYALGTGGLALWAASRATAVPRARIRARRYARVVMGGALLTGYGVAAHHWPGLDVDLVGASLAGAAVKLGPLAATVGAFRASRAAGRAGMIGKTIAGTARGVGAGASAVARKVPFRVVAPVLAVGVLTVPPMVVPGLVNLFTGG